MIISCSNITFCLSRSNWSWMSFLSVIFSYSEILYLYNIHYGSIQHFFRSRAHYETLNPHNKVLWTWRLVFLKASQPSPGRTQCNVANPAGYLERKTNQHFETKNWFCEFIDFRRGVNEVWYCTYLLQFGFNPVIVSNFLRYSAYWYRNFGNQIPSDVDYVI